MPGRLCFTFLPRTCWGYFPGRDWGGPPVLLWTTWEGEGRLAPGVCRRGSSSCWEKEKKNVLQERKIFKENKNSETFFFFLIMVNGMVSFSPSSISDKNKLGGEKAGGTHSREQNNNSLHIYMDPAPKAGLPAILTPRLCFPLTLSTVYCMVAYVSCMLLPGRACCTV